LDEAEAVDELKEFDTELEETGKDLLEHGEALVLLAGCCTSLDVQQLRVLEYSADNGVE